MACYREDAAMIKMRACNSLIRNQNHILKCTLKTLLDHPTRARDRALSSLIGLCRKQCNGPIVRVRPRRVISMPIIVPEDYIPICPPPIIIKKKKPCGFEEPLLIEEKKPRKVLKTQVKPFPQQIKNYDKCGCHNTNQCVCVCCGALCPTETAQSNRMKPSVQRSSPRGFGETSVPDFTNKAASQSGKCTRRCCLQQNSIQSVPLAMSPLCCPSPVKSTSPNRMKCTPIVRSYRCIPEPVGRHIQNKKPPFSGPSWPKKVKSSASAQRPLSAPDMIRIYRPPSNICGFGSYNLCKNNNDSEIDSHKKNSSQPATENVSSLFTNKSTMPSSLNYNSPNLFTPSLSKKYNDDYPLSKTPNSSEFTNPTLRSTNKDPFSITTWKTSKPVRFSQFSKGMKK